MSQDPFSINKAEKKKDYTGAATAAGGVGIIAAVPQVSRTEKKISGFRQGRIDRKIEGLRSSMPQKPSQASRQVAPGYTRPEPPKVKAARHATTKKIAGEIKSLQGKRKLVGKPILYNKQSKLWGGALAVGGTAAYLGARKQVEKKLTKNDVDAGAAGAAGGFVGYQGGSLALKPLDRRAEKKIKNDPRLKAKQSAYQSAHRPKGVTAGDPAWRPYFRNYPKDLPGAALKRTQAVTHTGKSGAALTAGVTALAGAGAIKYNRNRKAKQAGVQKNLAMSAFGVDHG